MPGLWSAISPSQLRGKVQCGRGGGVCAVKPRGPQVGSWPLEGSKLSDLNPSLASASLPEAGDFLRLQQEPRAAPIVRLKVAARG